MCGRYVAVATTDELREEFAVSHVIGPDLRPSWNVAPTTRVRIVTGENEATSTGATTKHCDAVDFNASPRTLRTARWGLVPPWAKNPAIGSRMINARSETVTTKSAFKAAAARRRCLVPAAGYYEWMRSANGKTPYFLHDATANIIALAGLYERWYDDLLPADHPEHVLVTTTIITRAAPDTLGHIHDRTPVLIGEGMREAWLDCSAADAAQTDEILEATPPPTLQPREVGAAVGNIRHNDASLIEPVSDSATSHRLF